MVERDLAKVEVAGSSPVIRSNGSIAQLGEHLPYKQRVIGSSPIVPTKKALAKASAFFNDMFRKRNVMRTSGVM